MAFTAKLGTSDSKLANIELGFGATITPHAVYSGIYTLVGGKTHDTLYSNISLPLIQTADVAIPNPFFLTGLIGD